GGMFCRFVDPDGNVFALAGFDHTTRELDQRRRAYAEKLETERRAAQELNTAVIHPPEILVTVVIRAVGLHHLTGVTCFFRSRPLARSVCRSSGHDGDRASQNAPYRAP